MRVAVACGGTGGHIFPGVATADILRERGHDPVLWLAGKDIESRAVRHVDFPVETVRIEGVPRWSSLKSMGVGWRMLGAIRECRRRMRAAPPDVLLAMGSYASVGPAGAALTLRIPVVLHEANVIPGRAIALLSKWATAVAGSFEETRYYLRREDMVLTGMPIRGTLERAAQLAHETPREKDRFTVLVMGGSRGAHALNEAASQALCRLQRKGGHFRVHHLSGPDDVDKVRARYEEAGVDHRVYGFVEDMAPIYGEADIAICRSGAASCAELSAFGVPALMVPYPHAAKDHQTANARAMEKMGAADWVAEESLSAGWLADYLRGCIESPARLARMRTAARARFVRSASGALADLVERAAARPAATAEA